MAASRHFTPFLIQEDGFAHSKSQVCSTSSSDTLALRTPSSISLCNFEIKYCMQQVLCNLNVSPISSWFIHPECYAAVSPSGMYVCMYVCMHACMHVCMHLCMYVCMHVCMYACMYAFMYVCICICMYVCMYVCMYFRTEDTSCRKAACWFVLTFETLQSDTEYTKFPLSLSRAPIVLLTNVPCSSTYSTRIARAVQLHTF